VNTREEFTTKGNSPGKIMASSRVRPHQLLQTYALAKYSTECAGINQEFFSNMVMMIIKVKFIHFRLFYRSNPQIYSRTSLLDNQSTMPKRNPIHKHQSL